MSTRKNSNNQWHIILPGNGPWRVADECEATFHNTQSAADRRDWRSKAFCTCPHALVLKAEGRARKSILNAASHQRRRVTRALSVPPAERAPRPDTSLAACATPLGIEVMDRVLDREDVHNLARARALCSLCPIVEQCKAWALDNGPFPGVYGGLGTKEQQNMIMARSGATA